MRNTILFIPEYSFITILSGGDKLRLFHVSGALSEILPDAFVDDVEYVNSALSPSFLINTVEDLLTYFADDLWVKDIYVPESVQDIPEDVYEFALVVELEPDYNQHHSIVPIMANWIERGWRS